MVACISLSPLHSTHTYAARTDKLYSFRDRYCNASGPAGDLPYLEHPEFSVLTGAQEQRIAYIQ